MRSTTTTRSPLRSTDVLRTLIIVLSLVGGLLPGAAHAARRPLLSVEVADPYIEMHTGPGRGFPVFNVADSSITVGTIVLLLGVYLQERAAMKEKETAAKSEPASESTGE